MEEIWKDIKGYEGMYQVSNLGRIKSLARMTSSNNGSTNYLKRENEKILMTRQGNRGYLLAYLTKNSKTKTVRVHRLVAENFIPNPENKPQVNHINGIKTDNRLENLEWNTCQENTQHAVRTGLKIVTENQKRAAIENILKACEKNKVKVMQFDLQGNYIKTWNSILEAKEFYGLKSNSGIVACCQGKYKKSHGFIWKYAEEKIKK